VTVTLFPRGEESRGTTRIRGKAASWAIQARRPSRGPAGQAYYATRFGWRLRGDIRQDQVRSSHHPPVACP